MASSAQQAQAHEMATPYARTSRIIGHKNTTLYRALEKAQSAVERDQAGNVRGALASYRCARELLSKARRRMSSDDDALKLDAIGRTYDNRIRELREAINNEPRDDDEDSSDDKAPLKIRKPSTGAANVPQAMPKPSSAVTPRFRRITTSAYSPQDSEDSQQDMAPSKTRKPRLIARKPIVPQAHVVTAKCTITPVYPPRRDSHQQWPLTPELETKATVERYMKRRLPERPDSRAPRYVKHFDDCHAEDENIEVLIDWWNDLLEGGNRWSMSSDKSLVASPAAYHPKEYRKSSSSTFAQQRNGSESPTDSVRFWSPPATPVRNSFGNGMVVRQDLTISSLR